MSGDRMICAGNWKMNLAPEQASTFARTLKTLVAKDSQSSFVVLPQALLAERVATEFKDSNFGWGGQNCYFASKGAFTGENSPQTLVEMGARYCLVGHSERRQLFAEDDETLAKKNLLVQQLGLTPIFCVGETLAERQSNQTRDVIVRQLQACLKSADPLRTMWLAYEPVWAIGTGLVATPEQVAEAHSILRQTLIEWNPKAGATLPILYGGSVKSDNAATLATIKNVNGFLIGGASLDVQEFVRIHQVALGALGR